MMRSKEFCKKLGISIKTLERKEQAGEIIPIRKGRLRYYTDEMVTKYFNLQDELKPQTSRKTIAYYRVSTNSQKQDLENQRKALENFSINSGIIIDKYLYDIGSGINFKRPNFLKLIDMIERHEVKEIIVTYKDRFSRFAMDLILERCKVNDVKFTVINIKSSSPHEELVEDLMTIIHVFSCRLYGLRKYKNSIKKDITKISK